MINTLEKIEEFIKDNNFTKTPVQDFEGAIVCERKEKSGAVHLLALKIGAKTGDCNFSFWQPAEDNQKERASQLEALRQEYLKYKDIKQECGRHEDSTCKKNNQT